MSRHPPSRRPSHLAGVAPTSASTAPLRFAPLTPERWPDLESLFGPRGACGGCWCMAWRRTRAEYERGKGAGNKRAFRRLVSSGQPPGILAYYGDRVVGWCAVAPRDEYGALARSRVLRPIDDQPVWSISCLFVDRSHRRRGVGTALIDAAARFAATRGARLVEGYPVEPSSPEMPPVFAWTGTVGAFRGAGFDEVARGSPKRPIMRRAVR